MGFNVYASFSSVNQNFHHEFVSRNSLVLSHLLKGLFHILR